MKTEKYKILYIQEQECHEWSLEEILHEINRDRNEHWIDYDETDWREGWNEWVEGEFYSLVEDFEDKIVDIEDD